MTDETACPPGCDSIMVLVPCPTLMRNKDLASLPRHKAIEAYKQQFDEDLINDARDAVFERLSVLEGLENVQDLILNEVVDNPATYADYYNAGAGECNASFVFVFRPYISLNHFFFFQGVPFGLVSVHYLLLCFCLTYLLIISFWLNRATVLVS